MRVELRLQPERTEPKVIILADAETAQLRELIQRLEKLDLSPIPASCGEQTVLLEPEDILRFYTDGKLVTAQTADQTYSVRMRLYELEERLNGRRFVRISNSEIVNLNHVTALDLSLAGTIRMTLNGTVSAYVSRRYVKKIKQAVGL